MKKNKKFKKFLIFSYFQCKKDLKKWLKILPKKSKNDENYKNLLVNIAVSIVFTLKINSYLEIIKSCSS